ncbi:hypothetical protein FisN_18Lu005 [Fistulifera solaris]|uniref:EGF-like domain-containing protein n=1 Tax=Fistulifera solaris TaxID=1519565 RepID=A0A1Z5K1R9_FISSO|nr:hypothetical protein FisN_18Lu005 [Fistulifera solaris]|eukprot:GAX20076.1 hypothetical protein FisN_18Lu005 [Fistulifera solaris]
MRISAIASLLLLAAPTSAQTCRDLGKGVIDQGCNEDFPTCVYANGGQVVGGNAGHHCALCINSRFPSNAGQTAPDEGCDEEFRVCVGGRQLAANAEGTACAVCFNSISATSDPRDIDDGCPPEAPVCVNDSGASPAIWTPGTNCVAKCVDTSLASKDRGCPPSFPHCVLADGSDPGRGNAGTECSVCSPALCDDNDPCTDDFCDETGACSHEDNGSCSCPNAFDWTCFDQLTLCTQYPAPDGFSVCVCDLDTEGNPFCWRNDFCSNVSPCTSSADCGPNQRCTSSCCGTGNCWDDCALTEAPNNRELTEAEYSGPNGAGL